MSASRVDLVPELDDSSYLQSGRPDEPSPAPPQELRPLAAVAYACTVEDHEALKADPARVAAETSLLAEDHQEAFGIHLRFVNCRACTSTLAIELEGHVY